MVTFNKLSEIMTPFYGGNKNRPRINVTTGDKTFNWLFDTGAAITCMNANSFRQAFSGKRPKLLHQGTGCVAANGSKMNSLGVFELPMTIRGRSFLHPVTVVEDINDNIIGIDFIHANRMNYDAASKQITFAHMLTNALYSLKETTIPALSTMIITAKFKGTICDSANPVATIHAPNNPTISGMPALVTLDKYKHCKLVIDNCAPYEITLARNDVLGVLEFEPDKCIPLNEKTISALISDIHDQLPKVPKKKFTRAEIEQKANLKVPAQYKQKYLDILFKHQDAISINKFDLGRATNFTHKIYLKDNNPVYRKQFKIPEAHQTFIEATLDEWLKLGVVKRTNSLYNSPLFCVPKKQGQGLRIVQDFRELNNHSHIDKYSMKEITECIGDIGRANSTIFSTLDLTSGFWQMKLDKDSQPLTAFTIPGKGQFAWVTSPMGLLGCPASFQRLMEAVLRNINNVLVYIDDLLVHTATHDDHLQVLEKVFERLHANHLKVNLEKCVFGNQEVSYLGFTLTPEGIKPGRNKLQAIKDAKPPTTIKMVRSFVGLCNFFRTHIKDFAIIAAPLFKVTRKDSGYKSGPLPPDALHAFKILQQQLTSDPVMAFPRADRQYALITDAATGTSETPGGLGAILTQIDQQGNHYAISFASRQLKDHEKNYSPFLLEAAAAVWGMDVFNEYLRGKQFILFTDHKPLEKLGHLHTKTLNRLQAALLEHDFVVQYKKGTTMPADYLSRLPSFPQETKNEIAAFDPFQHDLPQLQNQDPDLQAIFQFIKTGNWFPHLSKRQIRTLATLAPKVFFDKNKLAWIRLDDYKYPRTALWLPEFYRKPALCESHDQIFAGHNAAQKSYLKLTSSYFWPNVYTHILKHTQTCLRCQQRKLSRTKKVPLAPLPIPDQPNVRVHADLFGPMLGTEKKSAYILCITDAFTKYAVVTKIDTKDAETVAKAIFDNWFCKFGIPAQLHTDGGKEFVNKLSAELFELLNVQHSKTSPYHPQCNAQVEVFNKTVKKYLASYVDESTLNWEEWLPALMLAYNTSYHSTIATTPFELLFGVKPRLPSLPAPEIERYHYGESFAAERLQMLHQARKLAHQTANEQGEKYKNSYDKNTALHTFAIGQKVWLSDTTSIGKNAKLAPNWVGPYEIVDVNDTNAKLKIKNKLKIVNIARLKPFMEETKTCLSQDNSRSSQSDPGLSQDQQDQTLSRPMTRAFKKLTDLKNAASLAISLLADDKEEECYGNIFSENFDKNHCSNCRNGIRNFLKMPNLKQFLQQFYVGPICSTDSAENIFPLNVELLLKETKNNVHSRTETAAEENLIKKDADRPNIELLLKTKNNVHLTTDPLNNKTLFFQTKNNVISKADQQKQDQAEISAIKEELRSSLLSIASKLLASEHTRLHHLSKAEQQLWNSFEKADIYEFLTGEKDCIPEFQFNWFSPEAPAIRQVFPQPQPPPAVPLPAAQPAPPVLPAPPAIPVPLPPEVPAPAVPPDALPLQHQARVPAQYQALVHQEVHLAEAPQPQVPQGQKVINSDRVLRDKVPINYQEMHTGVKKKCRSLQRKAKAVVTKLAPGSFSPKAEGPSTSK
jgi:transposase InsO family protein